MKRIKINYTKSTTTKRRRKSKKNERERDQIYDSRNEKNSKPSDSRSVCAIVAKECTIVHVIINGQRVQLFAYARSTLLVRV